MLQRDPAGDRTQDLRIKSPPIGAESGDTGNPGENENAVQGGRTEFSDDSGKVESPAAFPTSEEDPKPPALGPMLPPPVPMVLAQFVSLDESRPALALPYIVEDGGVRYTIATNGRRLIAVAGDLGFAEQDQLTEKTIKILRNVPEGESVQISLSALREFLGATLPGQCDKCQNRGTWPCDHCQGTGYVDHLCNRHCDDDCIEDEDYCERCEAAGKFSCAYCTNADDHARDVDPVRLGHVFFNRWMLIPAVRYLSGETARLVIAKDRTKATLLACDDGRVILMPLRDESPSDERFRNAPSFLPPAA